MSKFRILVCEDSPADSRNILLYISNIKRSLQDVEIVTNMVGFEETYAELENDYELLILDLGDAASNSNAGENILLHNKGMKNIPTLVYTATADSFGWDFKQKKIEYPFLVEKLTKIHNSGENLQTFVRGYIIVGSGIKKYSLYNPHDAILVLSIKLIGEESFNYILHKIFEKFGKKEITVYPMTSGLSGAVLFKLEIENSIYILKLSKEVLKLREELENGKDLYNQFPSHLTNYILPEDFESFDKSVVGFLIKNVDRSQTLFDYINNYNSSDHTKLFEIFNKLYLDPNSLSEIFQNKRKEKSNWVAIFKKIDENKILIAKKAFNELKPILDRYYEDFDFEDFRRLAISNDYGNLTNSKSLDTKYLSELVLSHGDFHSKNILIQDESRIIIIDTGAIQYQHWSLDYSRLIVHLLINGIDNSTVEFFELTEIPSNILLLDKIIEGTRIELDGRNDNFITAINWLIQNFKNIYPNGLVFELQIGLMKEFLQMSYRSDTMPASKRALALIGAHKCMLAANASILTV